MARVPVAQALRSAFAQAFADDASLVAAGEGMGRTGGIDGLFTEIPADRRLESPIADRGTLALALGLALAGRRVIVELPATSRLYAAAEVLAEAAAIHAAGESPVALVVRVPTGGEAGPVLDRGATDVLAAIPGLRVLAPAHADDVVALWAFALQAAGPTVILEPRAALADRCAGADVRTSDDAPRVVRAGDHVTLIAWGGGVPAALEAADLLDRDGVTAEVVDLRRVHPLDARAVGALVRRTGRAVVVVGPEGGLAERAIAAALDEAFLYLEAPFSIAPAEAARVAHLAADAARY